MIQADPLAVSICETMTARRGCEDALRPQGTCMTCRELAKVTRIAARPKFEAETFDDAAHFLASAGGAECLVCKREPAPGLTFKNMAVCAPCASVALGRMHMNDVSEAERTSLLDGMDRAGEYLVSLDDESKFDIRNLEPNELDTFLAHLLCGFSESMRNRASETPPF